MSTRFLNVILACVAATTLAACDVDVEEEGRMPKVDVEPGKMPDVEVRGPEVEVGTQEKTITLPDVDVDLPQEHDNEPGAVDPDDIDDDDDDEKPVTNP